MNRLMQVHALAAAVDAAVEHGIFGELLDRPAGAAGLADRLGLDRIACERVLGVLHANGFVEAIDGALHPAADLRRELRGPEYRSGFGPRLWAHLPHLLVTGEALAGSDLESRARVYSGSTPLLGQMWERPAECLADILASRLGDRPGPTILDVGAGAGEWSLALLRRIPGARSHALDLEPVLSRYRERAVSLGLTDRITCAAGDFHHTEVSGPFDVVVLANVLHLETAPTAARLVARWAEAVARDGLLVVVDALCATADDPRHAAYALHLSLRLPGGYPHLEPELMSWLAAAQMGEVQRVPLGSLPDDPFGALIASRST